MYTTSSEKLLLFVGSIASIISGATFPFFLLFLADITTLFDENNRSETGAKGWQFCWRLFVVGGVIWVSRNNFVMQISLGLICGIRSVRPFQLGLRRCTIRFCWSKK